MNHEVSHTQVEIFTQQMVEDKIKRLHYRDVESTMDGVDDGFYSIIKWDSCIKYEKKDGDFKIIDHQGPDFNPDDEILFMQII